MALFDDIFIASDIDGTFFDDESKPAAGNTESIKYFIENGGLFTFVTGRNVLNILEGIPDIATMVNAPVIFCNGTGLYDARKREVSKNTLRTADLFMQAAEYIEKYPHGEYARGRRFFCLRTLANDYIKSDFENRGKNRFVKPFDLWRGRIPACGSG